MAAGHYSITRVEGGGQEQRAHSTAAGSGHAIGCYKFGGTSRANQAYVTKCKLCEQSASDELETFTNFTPVSL